MMAKWFKLANVARFAFFHRIFEIVKAEASFVRSNWKNKKKKKKKNSLTTLINKITII